MAWPPTDKEPHLLEFLADAASVPAHLQQIASGKLPSRETRNHRQHVVSGFGNRGE